MKMKISLSGQNIPMRRQLCRLCASFGNHPIDVLDNACRPHDLSDVIFRCVGIRIEKNDRLPTKICKACLDKVDDFMGFREMCVATVIHISKLMRMPLEGGDTMPDLIADSFYAKLDVTSNAQSACTEYSPLTPPTTEPRMKVRRDLFPVMQTPLSPAISELTDAYSGSSYSADWEENLQFANGIDTPTHRTQFSTETNRIPNDLASCDATVICLTSSDDESDSGVDTANTHEVVKSDGKLANKKKKRVKSKATSKNKAVKRFSVRCESGRCEEMFESRAARRHHLANYHAKGIKNIFSCHMCEKTFQAKRMLRAHMISEHLPLTYYFCSMPNCLKFFTVKSHLQLHMNAVHTKKITHHCTKCSFKTHYKQHLKKHVLCKHGKGITYRCDWCDRTFPGRLPLQQHINSTHDAHKGFQCPIPICSMLFTLKTNLRRHIKNIHARRTPFNCTKCSHQTWHQNSLRRHLINLHGKDSITYLN